MTDSYDLVYKWFDLLSNKKIANVVAYVIMPNHLHNILYFPNESYDLNKIIGNAKRFMAYSIPKRLLEVGRIDILEHISVGLTLREKNKGQKRRVFEESFDAKPIYSEYFLLQKMDYIHYNPVVGKWHLVEDYTKYEHSSASFYEYGEVKHFEPVHFRDL